MLFAFPTCWHLRWWCKSNGGWYCWNFCELRQWHRTVLKVIALMPPDTQSWNKRKKKKKKRLCHWQMFLVKQWNFILLLKLNPWAHAFLIFCVTEWAIHIKHLCFILKYPSCLQKKHMYDAWMKSGISHLSHRMLFFLEACLTDKLQYLDLRIWQIFSQK